MMGDIQNLAYGIGGFALIIGTFSVILVRYEGALGTCPSVDGNTTTYNYTLAACEFDNGNGSTVDASGEAASSTRYLLTQLGSSGLAGWIGAIVALTVGVLFLRMFFSGGMGKGRAY